MLWVTEAKTQNKIAINPEHVVAIFKAVDGEFTGKTIVGLVNGQVAIDESDIDIVGQLNAV